MMWKYHDLKHGAIYGEMPELPPSDNPIAVNKYYYYYYIIDNRDYMFNERKRFDTN